MSNASVVKFVKALLPEKWKREVKTAMGVPDTEACLKGLKRCGFKPGFAIDVGAYSGDWTRMLLQFFPDAQVLMIEPQETKRKELESICSANQRVQLSGTLVGATRSERVGFYENETSSSMLRDANHSAPPTRFLRMDTLDAVANSKGFPRADLIKLDVQGAELEVLKGGEQILETTEVVLMEINLIPIYTEAPLAHDALRFLADRDFRLYDLGTLFRRPYDKALWQLDALFVRSTSPLVSSVRWS